MGIADILKLRNEAKAKKNLDDGIAFLAENKNKSGVICQESGLQYEVINTGADDRKPLLTDTVTCHYEGKLLDGTIFDSTIERGKPATFALNKVIDGWKEGLQLMNVGSEYVFYIPSHLGYGAQQVGAKIAPNSLLIFKVTLLDIK